LPKALPYVSSADNFRSSIARAGRCLASQAILPLVHKRSISAPSGIRPPAVRFSDERQFKADQFSLVEPCCVTDLVEIVIFRGHPKNRHRWNSAARQLLGDLYASALINGISRPAEQPYLLPETTATAPFSSGPG